MVVNDRWPLNASGHLTRFHCKKKFSLIHNNKMFELFTNVHGFA